jgi:hypothetical protein
VWHHKRQKYHFISLKALTEIDAIGEALETYAQLTAAIEKNLPITTHAKKLDHYIELFMQHMEVRKKNGKITPKRVVIVRQLLRSLERFYDEKKAPSIGELPHVYEAHYETWRNLSLTRLTAKPLTPSSRNNEYNCHRQFFGFLRDQEIISKESVEQWIESSIKSSISFFNKFSVASVEENGAPDDLKLNLNFDVTIKLEDLNPSWISDKFTIVGSEEIPERIEW